MHTSNVSGRHHHPRLAKLKDMLLAPTENGKPSQAVVPFQLDVNVAALPGYSVTRETVQQGLSQRIWKKNCKELPN
jgi:hypothetical protein